MSTATGAVGPFNQNSDINQIVLGIIFLLLGGGYNINKEKDQKRADTWNNIALAIMVLTLAINVLISTFEIREINHVQETPKYSGYYQY